MASPRARLLRRGLDVSTGYPTTGLIAYFDLMQDNLLIWSEDLTNAAWLKINSGAGSAVPVVTNNYATAPDGTTTATRLQFNRGADAGGYSIFRQSHGLSSVARTGGRWMRATSGTAKINHSVGDTWSSDDLTETWTFFSDTQTGTGGFFSYGLSQSTGITAETADILTWRPQVNPGTTARPYQLNTDLQSLGSLYGKTPTLQRGATSGAEASDPALGEGMGFVTDDYAKTPDLGILLPNTASLTLLVVGKFGGTGDNKTLFSLGTSQNDEIEVYRPTTNNAATIYTDSTESAAASSGELAVSATGVNCLVLTKTAVSVALKAMDTGGTVTVTQATGAYSGQTHLTLGASASSTSIVDAMTVYLCALHNGALFTAQIQRAYRALKAHAARKGVSVL